MKQHGEKKKYYKNNVQMCYLKKRTVLCSIKQWLGELNCRPPGGQSRIKTTKPCHPLVNTRKRELNLKQRKNKTTQRVKKGDRKEKENKRVKIQIRTLNENIK